jgi:hypothetical protein
VNGEEDLDASGTARVYITRKRLPFDSPWASTTVAPPKAALPAGRPFAQRPESQWSHQSGSMTATTCRPLAGGRGWPARVQGKQACFYALFALGLMRVMSDAVVGCFPCKRRAVLFWALPFCAFGQWTRRTAFYSILAQ